MPDDPRETPLISLLRTILEQEGSISFARFMEIALYHPRHGYYAQAPSRRIGVGGDYYTGSSAGPAFGRLFAETVAEVWRLLGQPESIDLWEQGAGNGWLACDLMEAVQRREPELAERIRYVIVEPRSLSRAEQVARVSAAGFSDRFRWVDSWGESERIVGIFLSNELVDSFPVRRFVRRGGGWTESVVCWKEGALRLEERPVEEGSPWEAFPEEPAPGLPEGWVHEVSPEAPRWMQRVGRLLGRGFVFTFDYGSTLQERLALGRAEGTLRAYHRHQRVDDLLAHPGEQDLTAHVDFGVLARSGSQAGLRNLAWIDQHHFFVGVLSALAERSEGGLPEGLTAAGFQTLAHPDFLGRTHRVLIQSKGIEDASSLSCLRFARSGAGFLGSCASRPSPATNKGCTSGLRNES